MSSRALPTLRPAAPEDHAADPVARSTQGPSDHRTTLGGAGTPSGLADAATATLGDALVNTESCLFGTNACTRRPTAVVTPWYTPGTAGETRPMCSEHVLVLVEAITEHGDGFTVTVAPLPRSGDTMSP